MQAYRTYIIIKDPNQVTLNNLPFPRGQYVEVILLGRDESRITQIQELEALFKETQSLLQVKSLKDEDILTEINAYRGVDDSNH